MYVVFHLVLLGILAWGPGDDGRVVVGYRRLWATLSLRILLFTGLSVVLGGTLVASGASGAVAAVVITLTSLVGLVSLGLSLIFAIISLGCWVVQLLSRPPQQDHEETGLSRS